MKKINHLSATLISLLFIILGMLSDSLQWEQDALVSILLLILGISGLAFIFIQLAAKYYCERYK